MGVALVRSIGSMAWELRAAWASGRRVALTIDGASRVEGHVQAVSATDATVKVAGVLIPLGLVLAVHVPSRLGDSTVRGGRWAGDPRRVDLPGQLAFVFDDGA